MIDVGANVGQTVRRILERFPEATIIACEPVPGALDQLNGMVQGRPNLRVEAAAIGETESTAEMELFSDTSEMNRIVDPLGAPHSRRRLRVRVTTLDELSKRHGVRQVDLLKIDTEGHEMPVLTGGKLLFEEGRVRAVFAECTFRRGDDRHTSFSELSDWLEPRGFECLGLYDVHHADGRFDFGNALFLRVDG